MMGLLEVGNLVPTMIARWEELRLKTLQGTQRIRNPAANADAFKRLGWRKDRGAARVHAMRAQLVVSIDTGWQNTQCGGSKRLDSD